MSSSQLLWSMLFGAIGMGMLLYGKKQHSLVPALCGLGLLIYPYFVSNVLLLVAIGAALCSIPYFLRS